MCNLLIPIIWILWDDKNQNLYDKFTMPFVLEKKQKTPNKKLQLTTKCTEVN